MNTYTVTASTSSIRYTVTVEAATSVEASALVVNADPRVVATIVRAG